MNKVADRSSQLVARLIFGFSAGALLFMASFHYTYDALRLFIVGATVGAVAASFTWWFPITYIFCNMLLAGMSLSLIGRSVGDTQPRTFFIGIAVGAALSMLKKNWQIVLITALVLFSVIGSLVPGEFMGSSLGWIVYGPVSPVLFAMLVWAISVALIHLL